MFQTGTMGLPVSECKHKMIKFCLLGHEGSRPSSEYCASCSDYEGKPRGAGDVIHSLAKHTGVDKLAEKFEAITGKKCGCQKRREALNKLLPRKSD
jgi:hypothetical protein